MTRVAPMVLLLFAACGKSDEGSSSSSSSTPSSEPQKVDVKKDPLAYKVQQLPGGTVAIFDNWRYAPAGGDGTWAIFDMAPNGRETDFIIKLTIGTPDRATLDNYFVEGPRFIQKLLQGFTRVGDPTRCKFGGDDAMIEEYEGSAQGKKLLVKMVYIRKGDVAVGVGGIGTEDGTREFGRAIEIVAQSLSFKESPIEPGLVGTWAMEKYYSEKTPTDSFNASTGHYITLFPNGAFTESSHALAFGRGKTAADELVQGANRGRVVKRGNVLTFQYDSGKTWNATYELFSNGLKLNGNVYLKQ